MSTINFLTENFRFMSAHTFSMSVLKKRYRIDNIDNL